MNPILMTALISGGINALQGKRGSDLLKSTVRDAAIAYALGPGATGSAGQTEGINQIAQQATTDAATQTATQAGAQQVATDALKKEVVKPQPGKLEQFFSKVEKPFLKPGTQDISKFRVGLGAAGLGGTAYAAGLFDPKPAPDPKYPGFNKFYAADPEMFQPLSGRYGPDTDKYPEGSPYSGMQEGGMAEEIEGPDDMMIRESAMMRGTDPEQAGIVSKLMERFQGSLGDPEQMARAMKGSMRNRTPARMEVSETMETPEPVTPMSRQLPARIQRDFILKFKKDPDKTAIEYAAAMRDSDRLTVSDVQRAKEALMEMTNETEMDIGDIEGIMGLVPNNQDVRIPQPADAPAALTELMETFRSRATNEPKMQEFNQGDIVDVLPSKYKRDENDESNYKRTSGKMVTDETGKGSGNKDTMLAQLADGEFVTKSKSVLGAGKAMGGKNKKEQRELGAQFFYKQMSELEKIAENA